MTVLPNFARLGVNGWVVLLACLVGTTQAKTLELHRERSGPTDLAVSGRLQTVPAGETRFIRWTDLRALPTTKLTLAGEFVRGEQEVTVVFLDEVWKSLPRGPGADVVLATCSDGYAGIFRESSLATLRPFVVLEINGQGPEKWPPPGLKFNPGPYVISVSALVAPEVGALLDPGHKKPWGVTQLEIANYEERFRDAYIGRRAALPPMAVAGREIWIHSCASCHEGPGTIFGGTKSDRPFAFVEAIAGYSPELFKTYIRAPKSIWPGARMEAHPHYSDAQLDGLIAFITAK